MVDIGEVRAQVRLNIRQAVAAYATLRAQNARTIYAMRGTGDAFVHSGKVMTGAGLGLIAVFGLAAKKAADFERKMDFFQAVTGTSRKEMEKLNAVTLKIAQDTIFSADQMATGMIELGKAGVSAREIIGGIGRAMANLAAAGDIPLAQSGQIIVSTLKEFDLGFNRATKIVDLLAGAANASIADIDDLGVSLKYVGGVANAAGAGVHETITAIALLANAGIRGSTAGTSLRQMLVSLPGVTKPARDELEQLGIITKDGSNRFYDMHGNLKPLPKVFQILHNSLQGMTREQKLVALRTIFNNRALAAAAILTRDGAKGFSEMNKQMSRTTAAETAHKRLDNLSGDIEILRGNIETLLVKAGSPFQETLRGWVQNLTKLVQAFANLSPETQKMILSFIGITGVVLTAMGVISVIIGTVFRFVVAMIRLYQATKFVVSIIRGFLYVMGIIAGGAISATVLAIVAVVLILAGAFIIAYKKSETFRNFINSVAASVWNAMKKVGEAVMAVLGWFQKLATDPKAAWADIKNGAASLVSWLGSQFAKLPGLIGNALANAGQFAGKMVAQIVIFFATLPGRILSAIVSLIPKIVGFFAQLPFRILQVLGFLLSSIPTLFLRLNLIILSTLLGLVPKVSALFIFLAGRVGYALGFMIGLGVRLMLQFVVRLAGLAASLVTRVVSFFISLPGRVARFIGNMVSRGIALFNLIRTRAPVLMAQMARGIISFVASLPGRVGSLISNMVNKARTLLARLPGLAQRAGRGFLNGIKTGIAGIPGLVSGVVGKAIAAFKSMVSHAFNVAKSFASGLWNGFKKGLFGSPRTKIEYAMEDMTATVGRETKRLRQQTLNVQRLSLKMAKTQFGVGDAKLGGNTLGTVVASKNISDKLAANAAVAGSKPRVTIKPAGGSREKVLTGTLRLHPDSRAYVEGVAQDVVDYNDEFDSEIEDM